MQVDLGTIAAIFRYPVKSMRGQAMDHAMMGWHGIEGDRRFSLRRTTFRGGFPWLTAGKLPELLNFTPHGSKDDLPTHVRTPEGEDLDILGEALNADISRRYGEPVEMMRLNHGIFDEAAISVIAASTVEEVCRLADRPGDVRRFRPNILLRTTRNIPFEEDAWVGGRLVFGEGPEAPTMGVTMRDPRCVMINFDPDATTRSPGLMKAVVRANDSNAGIYGTVMRAGRIAIGQTVVLHAEAAHSDPEEARIAEGVA